MQLKADTASVTNGSNQVIASADLDWSAAAPGSWFKVVGSNVDYTVAAVAFSDGRWRLTLSGNYAGATNAAADYLIQKDFDENGTPIFDVSDVVDKTLLNRWTRKVGTLVANSSTSAGNSAAAALRAQSILITGALIGAMVIPVSFGGPLGAPPSHVVLPTQVKSSPDDDNIPAVSVDSITAAGYNVNLAAPAISGHRYLCSHLV